MVHLIKRLTFVSTRVILILLLLTINILFN
nr:MAG TPA: hypothetical protein [Crassvirales sp.]